ncbi:MAG TPA: Gfo/Idh/MocA family oxidoreductase [Anaerolineae bacterium]|nr:Gfo/Idh/MocA family oxidoreductase [Anaerolineae bacterium]HOQ98073.1 Gfo/Idh/MocA family oxidoreductase [Anaerolineae bacterium]HPL27413.1 Gfo/Idh/MocA family oxidoreductase [Anaerolineae bacterium]
MAPLRVGVIGAGTVAAGHLRTYARHPGVTLVAVSDVSHERLAWAAREFDLARAFTDYRQLLALPDVQAVSVCLPNWLHATVTIEALHAGKHVLCEKPPALTAADAQRMAEAAAASGRTLMICFNYRYRNDTRFVKRVVAAGALGSVYYAKASWLRCAGIPGPQGCWFNRKALAGGGPLIDLGVHLLDLSLWLLGHPRPRSVTASTYAVFGPRGQHFFEGTPAPCGEPFEVEDLASAFIRLDNGATLLVETSWALHTTPGRDEYTLQLYGDRGGAELDVRNYAQTGTVHVYGDMAGVPVESTPSALQAGSGHTAAISDFVDCVRQGRAPAASPQEGVALMQLIEAIYRSAEEKREVTLP